MAKISVFEQFNILNSQIENIYNQISNTHKFYSTLCSSVIGVAILLYCQKIAPTEHFNYLYYIVILIYTISIIWYRNLVMYVYDINSRSDEYNKFIKDNDLLSIYNVSIPINIRKSCIIIPVFLGALMLCVLLRYSEYINFWNYLLSASYFLIFFLGFIYKFDIRLLKYM